MKKMLSIVGVAFISGISLTFIPEVRIFFYGVLGILFLFSIGAGYWGFRWIEHYVGIKEEEKLIKRAERKRKDVEAEVLVVNAKEDDQVYIRDNNHEVVWRNPMIDYRVYANGHWEQPSEQEAAAWMIRNLRKSPNQIPANITREEDYQEESRPVRYRKLTEVNDFIHMLIVGPSGSGKTTVANWEIDSFPRDTVVYALDPHVKYNPWSKRAEVIGRGRDFDLIDHMLVRLISEMDRRYDVEEMEFQKILIVIDEWLRVVKHCNHAEEFFETIGSEARKVNMNLIITTISSTVDDLNCSGAVRENLVQLNLNRSLKSQNLAELKWSKKEVELVELPGPYVPKSISHFNQIDLPETIIDLDAGPVAWSPSNEELKIDFLYSENNSLREIVRKTTGKTNGEIGSSHVNEVKGILRKFGHPI